MLMVLTAYCSESIVNPSHKRVEFHSLFVPEFQGARSGGPERAARTVDVLKVLGRQMGRPSWMLAGSKHAKIKESRFDAADGVWPFASPSSLRKASILCCGYKAGGSQQRSTGN